MAEMTEEAYNALDELWTRTNPEIDTGKQGYFTQHMAHLIEVDLLTAQWLGAISDSTHKTKSQIVGELVRNKIAMSK
jgi:hypothetical protein